MLESFKNRRVLNNAKWIKVMMCVQWRQYIRQYNNFLPEYEHVVIQIFNAIKDNKNVYKQLMTQMMATTYVVTN